MTNPEGYTILHMRSFQRMKKYYFFTERTLIGSAKINMTDCGCLTDPSVGPTILASSRLMNLYMYAYFVS